MSSFIIKWPKKSFPIELTNVADPPNLVIAIEALHAFPPVEKICFFGAGVVFISAVFLYFNSQAQKQNTKKVYKKKFLNLFVY